MKKHTKGPWRILPNEDDKDYLRIRGTHIGLRYKICNVLDPKHQISEKLKLHENLESQANAILIAEAPMLLEAAKLGLHIAESWIHDQLDGTTGLKSALEELEPIRISIAKATGETK